MKLNLNHLVFTPVILFSQLLINPLALAEIPTPEREALIALYNATSGPQWHNNSGWIDFSNNECDWFGVSCDVSLSSVTGLQLNANNLKGLLPDSIINFSFLNSINLEYNGVYSDSQTVNDFIFGLSELNYQHSQTVDANGLNFSAADANTLLMSWETVSYLGNEGGYRVYIAEQIDSEVGSVTSGFIKQGSDIIGKTNTTFTLSELNPCRQYFVKVITYTDEHQANINSIESDGLYAPVMGTIPGLDENCLITGSPYNDTFSINQTVIDNSTSVTIQVSANGERDYRLSGANVFHIDGAEGQDTLTVLGDQPNTWTLSSFNGGSVNTNTFNSIETVIGGQSNSDTLVGTNTDNEWSITETNTGTLNNSIGFSNVENLVGGSGIDTFTFTTNATITGLIEGGSGSDTIIGSATTDPQFGSFTCDSTSGATLSTGDFTAVLNTCPISLDSFVINEINITEGTIEPILVGAPSETIDQLLTMDGFEFQTEDGNTCIITDGQCIAEDGSVYVFEDGKLVKEETGGGSFGPLSLLFLMVFIRRLRGFTF